MASHWFIEGLSTTRPRFSETNYNQRKDSMEIFLKSKDHKI